MKTRAQIYGNEAAGLLRDITMYPGLSDRQLHRFYPGQEGKVDALLTRLVRQGRIYYDAPLHRYFPNAEASAKWDAGLVRAAWVLLDFIDKAEFHSASDFPVKIIFFTGGELYEIVYVPDGQEALIGHALCAKEEGAGRRIILVERPEQIGRINIPHTSGFCTVDDSGNINYYKKAPEGGM